MNPRPVEGEKAEEMRNRHRRGRPALRAVLGGEDYIEYIARSALAAGVGNSGPAGESTAYLLDARRLLDHAVGWVEHTFGPGDATIPWMNG